MKHWIKFSRSILFVLASSATLAIADINVSNVTATQRPGTKLVDINYNVSSTTFYVWVSLNVTHEGTAVTATSLSGNVGNVFKGNGRSIVWNAGADWDGSIEELSFSVSADETSDDVISIESISDQWTKSFYFYGEVTMTDHDNKLMWVWEPGGCTNISWYSAFGYCENLTYAGYTNWTFGSLGPIELSWFVPWATFWTPYEDEMGSIIYGGDRAWSMYWGNPIGGDPYWDGVSSDKSNTHTVWPQRSIETDSAVIATLVNTRDDLLHSVTVENTVTITGNTGLNGSISIPRLIDDYPVTAIGNNAFQNATNITSVSIPASVTALGDSAFQNCTLLETIYCWGSAPTCGTDCFDSIHPQAVVYYIGGMSGWESTLGGIPTAVNPNTIIYNLSRTIGTNGFGFDISSTNASVIVESSTNLVSGTWEPLTTNSLSEGHTPFIDPQATNYPGRYYRVTAP